MAKSKARLRAEAVERVRECGKRQIEKGYMNTLDLLIAEIGNDKWGSTYIENCNALIDLLTDEPTNGDADEIPLVTDEITLDADGTASDGPRGDAVEIMRRAAEGSAGGTGHVMDNARVLLGIDPDSGGDSVVFKALADMIERDYVGRSAYNYAHREFNRMNEERRGLRQERDYWKRQVRECLDAAYPQSHSPERGYAPEVMAYSESEGEGCMTPSTLVSAVIDGLRDERSGQYLGILGECGKWEARAKCYSRALEKLGCSVLANGTVYPPAMQSDGEIVYGFQFCGDPDPTMLGETLFDGGGEPVGWIRGWDDSSERSPLVNCGNPYREGDAVLDAGIIRPTHPAVSGGERGSAPPDSRDRLESDIARWKDDVCSYSDEEFFSRVSGWLDRQAAITASECESIYRYCGLEQVEELERRCSDLEARVEALDEMVRGRTDAAPDKGRW